MVAIHMKQVKPGGYLCHSSVNIYIYIYTCKENSLLASESVKACHGVRKESIFLALKQPELWYTTSVASNFIGTEMCDC